MPKRYLPGGREALTAAERQRRHRKHIKGDHSSCDERYCTSAGRDEAQSYRARNDGHWLVDEETERWLEQERERSRSEGERIAAAARARHKSKEIEEE